MEKEVKKTQLAWIVPISLQRISMSGPQDQYFVKMSLIVSGMVKVHRRMSEMARVVMNTFRGVSITLDIISISIEFIDPAPASWI